MSENMIFCLGDGRLESKGEGFQKNNRIFNKDVTVEEFKKTRNLLSDVKIILTKWVDKKDMTEKELKEITVSSQIGGYLKRFTYEEAWDNFWKDASQKTKDLILNLPQFDTVIFKEITGIEVGKDDNKKTELLAKANELLEKADELKRQAENL